MKSTIRTPENIALVKELYATGNESRRQIGERFGVGESTIRQWMMSEEEYAEYKKKAGRWQKDHAPLVNQRQREHAKNRTREEKDRRNELGRKRYQNDPKVKERMKRLMAKYRNTAQGTLSALVRCLAHGHSSRHARIWEAEITIITGMTQERFTKVFNADGVFDHIVPVCAFDLTNPHHFVRCCHPRNLRIVTRKENEMKGSKCPEGLDIMSLPWVKTDAALVAAQKLISIRLDRLQRNNEPAATVPV